MSKVGVSERGALATLPAAAGVVHDHSGHAQVVADPARVSDVEASALPALLAQLTTAAAVVAARLSTIEPRSAEGSATSGGDRLLTAKETAALLNLSTDFLYKHEAAKPFRVRIGSEVRFSLAGIQRFIERHRGR
jgi:predicted DNA-binding transcriptional regulator AlpA